MALTKIGKEGITGVSNSADANALFIDSSKRVGVGATPNTTFGSHLYAQGTPAANKPIISGYSQGNSNNAGLALLNDSGNRGIWTEGSAMRFTSTYEGNSTTHMNITSSGEITKPLQPAFLAHAASVQSNIAINTTTDIVFGTEVFDIGANFASNTFTAPVTGKYQISWCVYLMTLDTDTQYYQFLFLTSNRTYYQIFSPNFAADAEYQSFTWSGLIDMDASDTAKVQLQIPNSGAAQADVYGDSTGATFFSGFLAC